MLQLALARRGDELRVLGLVERRRSLSITVLALVIRGTLDEGYVGFGERVVLGGRFCGLADLCEKGGGQRRAGSARMARKKEEETGGSP